MILAVLGNHILKIYQDSVKDVKLMPRNGEQQIMNALLNVPP